MIGDYHPSDDVPEFGTVGLFGVEDDDVAAVLAQVVDVGGAELPTPQALQLAESVRDELKARSRARHPSGARLELATTGELLDELRRRMEGED